MARLSSLTNIYRSGEEKFPLRGLRFGHSWTASDGDNPGANRKFFLLPLQDSGKQIGDDVDLGEDLYLSSTMDQIDNTTCGYYGCRTLRIPGADGLLTDNMQSEQPELNHFSGAHAFRIQLHDKTE